MPDTSPSRPRSHGKLPPLPPGQGRHRRHRRRRCRHRRCRHRRCRHRRRRRKEGGPQCQQRAGDGGRGPLRKASPLRPGWEPRNRPGWKPRMCRRIRSRSSFPLERSPRPPRCGLPGSGRTGVAFPDLREDGVIAVGRVQGRARAGATARAGASSCRRGVSYRGVRSLRGPLGGSARDELGQAVLQQVERAFYIGNLAIGVRGRTSPLQPV